MVAIKSIKNKAYILSESLVGLALLAGIVSLLLTSIQTSRAHHQAKLEKQEALQVLHMVLQTQKNHVTLNGHTITIERTPQSIRAFHDGKEILHVFKP